MIIGKKLKGKPFVFQMQYSDQELPSEIQILPVGKWEHPIYGNFEINEGDIAEFKMNFDNKVRNGVPITEGHAMMDEKPARGWFTELIDKGSEGLWGIVEWTEKGKEVLKDKAFKYFSAEISDVYEDPQTGRAYNNVLTGGALTNHPFFKEMEGVVFSDLRIIKSFNDMDLQAILAKKPEELSAEEQDFLKQNKEELSEEQLATFGSVFEEGNEGEGSDDDEGSEGDEGADEGSDEGDEGEGSDEGDEGADEGKDFSDGITLSAAEYKALKGAANQGARAFAELRKNEIVSKVKSLTFSEQNREGRFLPKQQDAVVEFMSGLTAKQREMFSSIVGEMPKVQLFSEVGDGGAEEQGVAKELQARANQKMKENDKLNYSDAVRQIFSEDPEFAQRYNSEYSAE